MVEKVVNVNLEPEETEEEMLSSLELMWKLAFNELDAWAERLNHRDEVFLETARQYVTAIKRNQENVKAISAQFGKELGEWEKTAREELLTTTTSIQLFMPIKSYEEINKVVDDIQNKTTTLLATPFRALSSGKALDKYMDTVEQYISFRKSGRQKYIETVKKTTNVLYDNQKVMANLFSKQLRSAIFPFQKYMEKNSELVK
jgi:hypothetical protein